MFCGSKPDACIQMGGDRSIPQSHLILCLAAEILFQQCQNIPPQITRFDQNAYFNVNFQLSTSLRAYNIITVQAISISYCQQKRIVSHQSRKHFYLLITRQAITGTNPPIIRTGSTYLALLLNRAVVLNISSKQTHPTNLQLLSASRHLYITCFKNVPNKLYIIFQK
ncbi:Hypothetical_protein [Hexamita inflata]|uniref:Hypothetical_protein n=1 Tax=Hexamita inflata TaxID=28002 RepID=A0AA86Q789_9EUKA|nr:Hypothetical protein HINF_LOCUS41151 [Hexamita inflata]